MAFSGKICHYYLQGNCRYGENCWNQHPRNNQGYGPSSQSSGSSRRVAWGGHNQRTIVVQASSFPKSSNWHSNRDHEKTFHGPQANLGFSQNRFAPLNTNGDSNKNEEEIILEIIMKDMEIWESSGQWMFSSYSPSKEKHNISGFLAFAPEELRLEYYNCLANNNIQNYISTVQQLVNQWRSRLLELKNINPSTKTALISELKNVANQPQAAFGFGGQQSSAFGISNFPGDKQSSAKNFSFKSPSGHASVSSGSLPAFGTLSNVQNHPTLGVTSSSTNATTTNSVGFGYQTAPSAASFSFKDTAVSSGFGTSGFSGFGQSFPTNSSNNTSGPIFGIGSTAAAASPSDSRSSSLFEQPASAFKSSGASVSSVTQTNASEKLFTPKTELSADELKQFEAKKFTLGKIPLKPPPRELLSV